MSDTTRESGRVVWPEAARAALTLELARLSLFAAGRIIDDRMENRTLDAITVADERTFCKSAFGRERALNFGRMLAGHIWNRVYDEYVSQYPLLITSEAVSPEVYSTRRKRAGRASSAKRNHFVPAFATKPWADSNGNMLVAHHWVDGAVRFSARAYRNWGYLSFLYPPWLEEQFQAIESDAASPYRRLTRGEALPPDELRMFTSFLVLQMLRTPTLMARVGLGLRAIATRESWAYPSDAGSLRRAYETLFLNDSVHARLHAHLSRRHWRLLQPAGGWCFPRIDSGIVLASLAGEKRQSHLFPLSPKVCLCIGPRARSRSDPWLPIATQLGDGDTRRLVSKLVSGALQSVALPTAVDKARWHPLLARHMGSALNEDVRRYRAWGISR
jgi:hypothetical protein